MIKYDTDTPKHLIAIASFVFNSIRLKACSYAIKLLTSKALVAHPLPKVNLAISLKLAFLPSSPGRVPTMVAHLLKRYSPNIAVTPENAQERIPGNKPIAAKALGKARAPAPRIVLLRLLTDEMTEACPFLGACKG